MTRSELCRGAGKRSYAVALSAILGLSLSCVARTCEYKAVMTDEEIAACRNQATVQEKAKPPTKVLHQSDLRGRMETDQEVQRRILGYKPPDPNEIQMPQVGMRADEIKDHLFYQWRPNHINKTTTAHGVTEQWVTLRGYIYITNGIVTSVQEEN
jgi:hypothetical protein